MWWKRKLKQSGLKLHELKSLDITHKYFIVLNWYSLNEWSYPKRLKKCLDYLSMPRKCQHKDGSYKSSFNEDRSDWWRENVTPNHAANWLVQTIEVGGVSGQKLQRPFSSDHGHGMTYFAVVKKKFKKKTVSRCYFF